MANWREWVRDYWVYGVVGLVLVVYFGVQALAPKPLAVTTASSRSVSVTTSASASASGAQAGYVYVQGAVAHPGLYPVTGTTRWDAVVNAAGGLTAKADTSQLNLAKIASDQESLYVPSKGETVAASASAAGGAASAASGAEGLNLNTASEADLQGLSGIGPKRAADIIAYRDAHGGFKSVEELKEVSGIGDKILAALAPQVTVGP